MYKWLQRVFILRVIAEILPSTELSKGNVWPESPQKHTIGSAFSLMEPSCLTTSFRSDLMRPQHMAVVGFSAGLEL